MPYWLKWLLLPPIFCVAQLHAQPLQKTFSAWQISCNNINSCEARSLSGDRRLAMTISRRAGADDRPLLRIDYGNRYSGELNGEALQDNLLLDGEPLHLNLSAWQTRSHHLLTAQGSEVDDFIARVMNAKTLQLADHPEALLSLRGLKAALLLMDDVQGRVNNVSGWIRRGDAATADLPPAPALPQLAEAHYPPRALTREESRELVDFGTWHINNDACSLDPLRREVSVSPLSDDRALMLVSCEMGAYNLIDLAFEVTRQPPFVARGITLTLPFTPPGRSDRQLELINARFDADSGRLDTFSKNRGLGDCGVATRWQYDGRQFVLAEYAQESTCDAWHGSDRWPTLWVTQQAPAAASGSVEIQP